jgi:hypothetical protein
MCRVRHNKSCNALRNHPLTDNRRIIIMGTLGLGIGLTVTIQAALTLMQNSGLL